MPLQADAIQSSDLCHSIIFSLEETGEECKRSSHSGCGCQYSQASQCGSRSRAPTGVRQAPRTGFVAALLFHLLQSIIPGLLFSQTSGFCSLTPKGATLGHSYPGIWKLCGCCFRNNNCVVAAPIAWGSGDCRKIIIITRHL